MDFNRLRILRKLREQYKQDIAEMKQLRPDLEFANDQEELETLASTHLSEQLGDLIEEYCESVGFENLAQLVQLGVVCNKPLALLASQLDLVYPDTEIDRALRTVDEMRESFRKGQIDEPDSTI